MPVYDYTYQTWKGTRLGPVWRWLTIPKFTWMEFFGKRVFIWLFTVGWIQFVLRLGYVYLFVNTEFLKAMQIPARALPPIDAFFFKNLIDVQLIFCFIFAFQMGSGLVSRDLRNSAIVLYMSKPISRWEYFLGKFASLFVVLMTLTWLQATLLFMMQTIVAPNNSDWHLYFWRDYAWIGGAIVLYSAVLSAAVSLMILAASSLVKNSRYAGIIFAAYLIGSGIVGNIVREILKTGEAMALSPFYAAGELGQYIFRLGRDGHSMSCLAAWLGVIGICGLSAAILKMRLTWAARYGR